MRVHSIILFLLLTGPFNQSFGQIPHHNFRHYTIKDGLAGNKINAVYQDQYGFMWVGSDKGLNRYDGQAFQNFISEGSNTKYFKLNDIQVIAENNNLLWAGTKHGGIVLFQNNILYGYLWRDIRYLKHTLLSNEITSLLSTINNEMWVGTAKGISVYKNKQEHVINIDSSTVKNSLFITCLAEDKNHNIWAGTKENGIIIFDSKTKTPVEQLSSKDLLLGSQDSINYILAEKKDTIWVCTSNGLKRIIAYNKKPWKIENIALLSKRDNPVDIKKMLHLQENEYWLATRKHGIFIVNISLLQITPVKVSTSLRSNALLPSINDLFADKEQGIWIGQDSALSYYHPALQNFFSFQYAYGNNNLIKNIFSLYTDDHVNLILGSSDGLYLYNDKTEAYSPVAYTGVFPAPQFFYCFYKDEAGRLICGTNAGLKKIVSAKGTYFLTDLVEYACWKQLQNKKITCITPFGDSLLLFGSAGDGLIVWNKKRNTIKQFRSDRLNPYGLPNNKVNAIFVDSRKKIFVGTDKGFCLYDPVSGSFKNFTSQHNYFLNKPINDFYDDGKNIWMGSFGEGLVKFEPNREWFVARYARVPAVNVYQLLPDSAGNIWGSSEQGIIHLNPYVDDHLTLTSKLFSETDGFDNIHFNPYAAFQKDGWIYFGGKEGIVRFKPEETIEGNNFSPPIAFTKLTATDAEKNIITELDAIDNGISLSPRQKILQVEFAALSYVLPVHNEFSYWLEGLDKQWINIGNEPRVTFAMLPPGNYTLHIRAANHNKVWNMEGSALKITMQPYYWQTLWFKILVGVAIAALIIYIFSLYTRSRLKKQRLVFERKLAVQEERKRISSEMHDDIGAGLSSLRVYLDMLKKKMGKEKANKEVEKASETAEELIQQVREIVWTFNTGNDSLENLLLYIRRYFTQTLDPLPYTTEINFPLSIPDKEISGDIRRNIFLSVKEAVNNSIKHAQASNIILTMTVPENKLIISVKDNGKGFNAEELTKEKKGNGLVNMQKRLETMKGKCSFNNGGGTEVRFEIPMTES